MIALFVFYDVCIPRFQRMLTFSNKMQHSSLVTYDGRYAYITELNKQGIKVKSYPVSSIKNFIETMKKMPTVNTIISTFITDKAIVKWWPFSLNACNELDRKISGIDIGLTFNPAHLYRKILKYDGLRNYTIDYTWRKSDG